MHQIARIQSCSETLSSVAQQNLVIMNMLLNKCRYTNKITNQITHVKINEIHKLNDNQPEHSSRAMVDKIRGSGGPHYVNVTSQWLLILTPPHSSQYIIVLLIHDLSLYDQALRAATKWQPVLKKTFNISVKILFISTLQSQRNSTPNV